MSLYEVFSHSDRFHYRGNLFSLATCFLILCTTLTFLPPFLVTYFAGGFWIKESTYSEQARLNFSSKYLLTLDNNVATNPFFSSSYAAINSIFQTLFIPSSSTVIPIDNNGDGITDQFSITIELPLATNLPINNINLWLIFQYELRARQSLIMETIVPIRFHAPLSTISNPSVFAAGDLYLEQRRPIQASGSDYTYNTSVIDLNALFASSSLDFNSVLNQYFTRNYYTSFQSQYVKWTSGSVRNEPMLTMNVVMNVPSQSIRFIPGFWQEFKWGWIQYVSVLLPFIAVFNRIKEFVFRHRFVRTLVELPHHRYKDK